MFKSFFFAIAFLNCVTLTAQQNQTIKFCSVVTGKPLQEGIFVINSIRVYPDSLGVISFSKPISKSIHLRIKGGSIGFADTTFQVNEFHSQVLYFKPSCETSALQGEKDIKEGNIQFIIKTGLRIRPEPMSLEEQKKFGLRFIDFGCSPPADDCIILYNKIMVNYLDKKYGKQWRQYVEGKILGL